MIPDIQVEGTFPVITQVTLEVGTRVCLTTPSATRVYRTLNRPAIQETKIAIGEDAFLEYLPDHVIPYSGSRFDQSLHVEMATGSCGIFWDALAAGRVARGERWEFGEVNSRLEIYLGSRPVFVDRTRIRPGALDPKTLAVTDGFDYVATLVVVADQRKDWNDIVATMSDASASMPEIRAGVSALTSSGFALKLLAHTASEMTGA